MVERENRFDPPGEEWMERGLERLQLVSFQGNPPKGGLRQGFRLNPEIECFELVDERHTTLKYDNEKGPGGRETGVPRVSQPSGLRQGCPRPIDFMFDLLTWRLSIFS